MTKNVFLSYRRSDTRGQAGRLFDQLSRRLGRKTIFMDVDSLAAGQDFPEVIRATISASAAVVVLIGQGWLAKEGKTRKIDREDDFVRFEVAAALASGKPVIPVLVDGAAMPNPSDLPEELRGLSRLHAATLRHESWATDFRDLLLALRPHITPWPKRWAVVSAIVAATLLLFLFFWSTTGTTKKNGPGRKVGGLQGRTSVPSREGEGPLSTTPQASTTAPVTPGSAALGGSMRREVGSATTNGGEPQPPSFQSFVPDRNPVPPGQWLSRVMLDPETGLVLKSLPLKVSHFDKKKRRGRSVVGPDSYLFDVRGVLFVHTPGLAKVWVRVLQDLHEDRIDFPTKPATNGEPDFSQFYDFVRNAGPEELEEIVSAFGLLPGHVRRPVTARCREEVESALDLIRTDPPLYCTYYTDVGFLSGWSKDYLLPMITTRLPSGELHLNDTRCSRSQLVFAPDIEFTVPPLTKFLFRRGESFTRRAAEVCSLLSLRYE